MPYHPVFNVPAFDAGLARPLLPLHRGDRPAVRPPRRRARFSRPAAAWECPTLSRSLTLRRPRASSRTRRWRWLSLAAVARLPPGHARPAAATTRSRRAPSSPTAARRATLVANTVRARPAARRHASLRPAASTAARHDASRCRSRAAVLAARPGALQHLLLAVPRAHRQRRRHGGAARLPAAAVVPRRAPAQRAGRLLLRRHDQRLRRHAGLRGAGAGRRIAGRSPPTSARCS